MKISSDKGIGYVDPEEVRRIATLNHPNDEATIAIATATADIARREEMRRNAEK